MNRRLTYLRLLTVLCAAALLSAQAFGMARGYVCSCTGAQEWSMRDHCHGPHHEDCHRGEEAGAPHDESDGAGERREHQEVREDVQWRPVASLEAPALVPMLVAVLADASLWVAPPIAQRAVKKVGAGPPSGVAVARTIVLLI